MTERWRKRPCFQAFSQECRYVAYDRRESEESMSPAKRKPQRIAFTMARLERLQPPDSGRVYVHDTGCPGLCLCVTSAGTKTFYLYRWHDGRPAQIPIARFPALNVEEARRRARDLLAKLAAGIDVQVARQARRQEPTLDKLWKNWEAKAKPRKRSWAEDQRQYEKFLQSWSNRRLSSIKKADVRALHAKIGRENGPYAANRVLGLLRAMFNTADDLGYRGDNPAVGIEKYPEVSRDRFLQADELRSFFEALAVEPETWQAFFLLALLTGARRANVQAMRWDALDLARGLWLIAAADAKAGKPLVVPLSPQAVAIFQARRKAANASPYVFPSRGMTGHVTEPKRVWKRICGRAGLSDCRLHDLRRSLGSWMAISGSSLPIIGKSLGHSQPSTTAIYARLSVDPVKAAVTTAADAMLQAAGAMMDAGGIRLLKADKKGGEHDAQ
jgi:integrase